MFGPRRKSIGFAPLLAGLFGVASWLFTRAFLSAALSVCLLCAGVWLLGWVLDWWGNRSSQEGVSGQAGSNRNPFSDYMRPGRRRGTWTHYAIHMYLAKIDWYQFEKLNAALLEAEGYEVHHLGGAHPDGGVDIVAEAAGERTLVQCKHWLAWNVGEPVVRELLGAMTHQGVHKGQIRTFRGWTQPAIDLALQHGITIADGHALARDARRLLDDQTLDVLLDPENKCCPKCDRPMVELSAAAVPSAWRCSRYPHCNGAIGKNAKNAAPR